jgi:quinoprotein glucose dehydrogenase
MVPLGLALKTGTPNAGGPLVTGGGLVFIGAAMDSYLRAFDAATGAEIWLAKLPAGGQATPMSYAYKGRQYIVIAAGGHSEAGTKRGDYVVAFALRRPGEAGPSVFSRLLDHPGRRFYFNVAFLVVILAAFLVGARRVVRRRRKG